MSTQQKSVSGQYLVSVSTVISLALICYPFAEIIGYRTIALILLCSVSILAMLFSIYPVLVASLLSAMIWDFFFIPPHFTFHIDKAEDVLMLIMYFVIALLNGVLTSRIKKFQKIALHKEEKAKTFKLYNHLLNSLAHELRTPISTIIGATDNLIFHKENLSETNKQKLTQEISIAGDRLNRLVGDLLNISRIESGFIQPKFDWCNIKELVHKVINQLREEMVNHNLEVKISDNLPYFKLDFGLIEQVLINILQNAIQHTPAGTTIVVTADLFRKNCRICISDNGEGVLNRDLEKIFDKYYRSGSQKSGGLGLGLSIAKGFVEAHNGKISVDNQPDGGARFTITIPAEFATFDKTDDYEQITTPHN